VGVSLSFLLTVVFPRSFDREAVISDVDVCSSAGPRRKLAFYAIRQAALFLSDPGGRSVEPLKNRHELYAAQSFCHCKCMPRLTTVGTLFAQSRMLIPGAALQNCQFRVSRMSGEFVLHRVMPVSAGVNWWYLINVSRSYMIQVRRVATASSRNVGSFKYSPVSRRKGGPRLTIQRLPSPRPAASG